MNQHRAFYTFILYLSSSKSILFSVTFFQLPALRSVLVA